VNSRLPVPAGSNDLPTTCVLCSQCCGLRVGVEDGRIVEIRGDEHNPFSSGYTCHKAYRLAHYVEHAQRLSTPLKRQPDGSHTPISWDQAVDEIGGKLRATLDAHGPHSLALLGVGGQGNHMSVIYALSVLGGIGSRWWFNALAQEKTQRSLVDQWMMDAPSDALLVGHVDESDYVVILGSNPIISQRGVTPARELKELRKDPERTLVVVDPRQTQTARLADLHLPIKVGTDAYLLLALAAVIVQEDLVASDFLREKTTGFEEVAALLRGLDPDALARRCGLGPDQVRMVARGLAAARRGCLELDLGLEQSRFNTLTAYLVRLIMTLTDNLGREGGVVFVSTFIPRSPGGRRARHRAPVSGLPSIPIFAPVGMFSPNLFAEEVLRDDPGRIRAAIVEGSNPVLSYAQSARTQEALEALELSVAIEVTHTETTWLCDYVLPAPVGYEKWEVANFPKPFPLLGMQVRPPVVEAPPGPLPEPEIYHRLAGAVGLTVPAPRLLHRLARRALEPRGGLVFLVALAGLALLRTWRIRRAMAMATFWVYETLGPLLPGQQLAAIWLNCQGVAWTRKADVARQFPEVAARWNRAAVGNRLFEEALQHPEGVVLGRLDPARNLDDHVHTPGGRIRLAPEPMLAEIARALAAEDAVDTDFPFVLDGGMRTHWTANSNLRDPAWRKGKAPHCTLLMNDTDALRLGLSRGERVRVRSRSGAVELPVQPDSSVQEGHIHIPNGFGTRYPDPETGELVTRGVRINDLTDAQDRDPFTGCPHLKYVRCQVEAVASERATPQGA
jgi:anaerobic selenocysteine-containing dehydrogenase